MKPAGFVYLVGAGPGDPDLLTVKALRLLRAAEVVIHDRLVSEAILAELPASALRLSVGKATGHHSVPQDEINALIVRYARDGHRVIRLKGGDPFIFGRGGEEADALAAAGIAFEVVPGITAAVGCAAAAGIALTHRDVAQSVRLVTGHLGDDRGLELDWERLADPACTLVVYMGVATAGRMAQGLITAGLAADTAVAVVENGTTGGQRTLFGRLATLEADMAAWEVRPPALVIIGKVVEQSHRRFVAARDLAVSA